MNQLKGVVTDRSPQSSAQLGQGTKLLSSTSAQTAQWAGVSSLAFWSLQRKVSQNWKSSPFFSSLGLVSNKHRNFLSTASIVKLHSSPSRLLIHRRALFIFLFSHFNSATRPHSLLGPLTSNPTPLAAAV
jgi:hypothetical protein